MIIYEIEITAGDLSHWTRVDRLTYETHEGHRRWRPACEHASIDTETAQCNSCERSIEIVNAEEDALTTMAAAEASIEAAFDSAMAEDASAWEFSAEND